MKITLKPGAVIPENARMVRWNSSDSGLITEIIFEVPDPTPAAPEIIVFIADGEPCVDSKEATHVLDCDGALRWVGTDHLSHDKLQHYRQISAEDQLTLELRHASICISRDMAAGTTYSIRRLELLRSKIDRIISMLMKTEVASAK